MAKADVIALAEDFAGLRSDAATLSDATAIDRYYGDVVRELGLTAESACNAAFVAVVDGTATYALPSTAVHLMALLYDDTDLRVTMRRALEAYEHDWRTRKGRPRAYLNQDEDVRTFRIVPVPDRSGDTIGGSTPFTGTFPGNNLTFLFTENVTDVLPWDELWTALDVTSREFSRESDHFDPVLADTFLKLASVIRQMLGYVA